eukprot:15096446-Alexandrium_andersonii.AAC.1
MHFTFPQSSTESFDGAAPADGEGPGMRPPSSHSSFVLTCAGDELQTASGLVHTYLGDEFRCAPAVVAELWLRIAGTPKRIARLRSPGAGRRSAGRDCGSSGSSLGGSGCG